MGFSTFLYFIHLETPLDFLKYKPSVDWRFLGID